MKYKILIAAFILFCSFTGPGDPPEVGISFNSFWKSKSVAIAGYTKINARYEWVAGAFDSGLHVPQYNGVPSGLRSGVWTADGAVAVDTSNHRLYFYSGGSWRYSTSGTGGGTPTLQQVLTAGPDLTTSHLIDGGGNDIEFDNFVNYSIGVSGTNSGIALDARKSGGRKSAIAVLPDTLKISPGLGNITIDSLNYTLSTTGKKIMLRDTATGLVQNIDPLLLAQEATNFADTTNFKPVVINTTGTAGTIGKIYKATYWPGGGGGSPGGSNTQVQFNDGGSFGGDAGLVYNKTNNGLSAFGTINDLTSWLHANGNNETDQTYLNPGFRIYGNSTDVYGMALAYNNYGGATGYGIGNYIPTGASFFILRGTGGIHTGYDPLFVINPSSNVLVKNKLNVGAISDPTSTLTVGGSFATKYTATATGITLDGTHSVVNVTATGQTITLPTAASITGRQYTIKLTASGSATVATTSSQTIDGSTTYSLASQYKYVTVVSDGSNWIVTANN